MNAAGQVLIEYILLMLVFMMLVAKIAQHIPTTFANASPYLGGKIQQRLETGHGFSGTAWLPPANPKGGVK